MLRRRKQLSMDEIATADGPDPHAVRKSSSGACVRVRSFVERLADYCRVSCSMHSCGGGCGIIQNEKVWHGEMRRKAKSIDGRERIATMRQELCQML